jgi:hypothetical protein
MRVNTGVRAIRGADVLGPSITARTRGARVLSTARIDLRRTRCRGVINNVDISSCGSANGGARPRRRGKQPGVSRGPKSMRRRLRRAVPAALKPPPRSVMKPPPGGRPSAGAVPNPKRPTVVRHASGPYGDLFSIFPDLPWATRPPLRRLPRTLSRRLGRR